MVARGLTMTVDRELLNRDYGHTLWRSNQGCNRTWIRAFRVPFRSRAGACVGRERRQIPHGAAMNAVNPVCEECAKGPAPGPAEAKAGDAYRACKEQYDVVAVCMATKKGQVKACEQVRACERRALSLWRFLPHARETLRVRRSSTAWPCAELRVPTFVQEWAAFKTCWDASKTQYFDSIHGLHQEAEVFTIRER
jgi:hypothetical protein